METEGLIIRKFNSNDWKDLFEYLSQESLVNRSQNDDFWAVCLKENNKLIGNVYFQQKEPKRFLIWEIGYVFNPAYYGKGYATAACKRVLKYGFEQLGTHRVIGKCNP